MSALSKLGTANIDHEEDPTIHEESSSMVAEEQPAPAKEAAPAERELDEIDLLEKELIASGKVPSSEEAQQIMKAHLEKEHQEQLAAKQAAEAETTAPEAPAASNDNSSDEKSEEELEREREEEFVRKLAYAIHKQKGVPLEEAEVLAREEFERRKAEAQAQAQAGGQNQGQQPSGRGSGGGGSGLGAAIGSMFAGLGAAGKNQGALFGGIQEKVRSRIYKHWESSLEDNLFRFEKAHRELGGNVQAANEAFLASDGGLKLEALAAEKGTDVTSLMAAVNTGANNDPVVLEAVYEARNDPRVVEAWEKVQTNVDELGAASSGAARSLGALHKGFEDRFDSKAAAEKITEMTDGAMATAGKSLLADEDEDGKMKKLQEQLNEMIRSIQEMVERILNRIASAFRR